MSSLANYDESRKRPRSSYFRLQASMSPLDSPQNYGTRDMPPPTLNFQQSPMDLETNNSRNLPNPSSTWEASSFPSFGGFGETAAYPTNIPRQLQIEGQIRGGPPQDPLANWYEGNDGPWAPLSKEISSSVTQQRPRVRSGNRSFVLNVASSRSFGSSDQGTSHFGGPYSDSGYGSNPRRGDGDASIFSAEVSDHDQEFLSIANQARDYETFQSMNDTRHGDAWDLHISNVAVFESSAQLICPTCDVGVKTKSDLKKHELRHTKPFSCVYPGCSRKQGFSTRNDLDRHTKSLHSSVAQSPEPTKWYRCKVKNCKSASKTWPRLDNFKSHLRRVHHLTVEERLDDLVKQGEYWTTAGPNTTEFGIPASGQPPLRSNHQSMAQPMMEYTPPLGNDSAREADLNQERDVNRNAQDLTESNQDGITLTKSTESPFGIASPEQIKDTSAESHSMETVEPSDVEMVPSISNLLCKSPAPVSLLLPGSAQLNPVRNSAPRKASLQGKSARHDFSDSDVKLTQAIKSALVSPTLPDKSGAPPSENDLPYDKVESPEESSGSSSSVSPTDSGSDRDKDEEAEKKAIEVLQTLHRLGYKVVAPEPSGPQNLGSAAAQKSENLVICKSCGKFKGRPCELKKHMKRHSRPYGCTFPTCKKLFGSKNDWKRHENSQHFHIESWRCDHVALGAGECGRVCYRKASFALHLEKEHKISSEEERNKKTERCRIGRNCQERFWCGFCEKLVALTQQSVGAWAERFNHIDDHFMGRNGRTQQCISDWTPLDPHQLSYPEPERRDSTKSSSSESSSSSGEAVAAGAPKRKHSGNSSEGPASKHHKGLLGKTVIFRICCQCQSPHNARLQEHCMTCEDFHSCSNCKLRRQDAEDRGMETGTGPVDAIIVED